ncbi:hypothetical protein MVEN_01964700 [Mycena venus]|uniref:Uncharacterized protein n=1 Tax=Mycena venus TaxID=2733690 RepID=A0A8H6XHH0_9AGAR|nr:hypothetical protein MVEN_01964700 [Mycena venus]
MELGVCKRSNSTLSESDTIVGEDNSLPTQCTPVTFNPIPVESFNRYGRGRYVKNVDTKYPVAPFCRSFSRKLDSPTGILKEFCILCTKNIRGYSQMQIYKGFSVSGAEEINIVLDLVEDSNDTIKCGYYFVDHSMRSIFWMDVFEMGQLSAWKRVHGITSASHVGLILEHQYWRHCDLFPACRDTSLAVIAELRDAIVDSATDALTSPTTTVPFALDDLLKMLTLTNSMGGKVEGARPESSYGVQIDQGSSCAVARLMMLFAQERVNHFHGEHAARLDRLNSVYGRTPNHDSSWIISLLSPLLFNAPKEHFRNLRAIFTDDIISQLSWKRLMEKVLAEWQDMVLYASLILNANVGILAIPGSSNSSSNISIALVSSYMSICFGLGSIILGLLLSRKYRLEAVDAVTATPAYSFKQQSLHALEARAFLFSLPYVFMMWGMATFLSSFLIMALQLSNVRLRTTVLITAAILFLVIVSCLFSAHGWGLARIIRTIGDLLRVQSRPRYRGHIDIRQFWRAHNERMV